MSDYLPKKVGVRQKVASPLISYSFPHAKLWKENKRENSNGIDGEANYFKSTTLQVSVLKQYIAKEGNIRKNQILS